MRGFNKCVKLPIPLVFTLALVVFLPAGRAEQKDTQQVRILTSFEGKAGEPEWQAVNDGVMGGLSKGGPAIKDGSLHFSGTLSLENNGGFSSVRAMELKQDFTGKPQMVMRVKGDGRTYQLRLSTDALYQGSRIAYGGSFATEDGKWIEVRVPFESLAPSWRGKKLDGPPLDLSKIREISIMIADKKPGPFVIEVDWIGVG